MMDVRSPTVQFVGTSRDSNKGLSQEGGGISAPVPSFPVTNSTGTFSSSETGSNGFTSLYPSATRTMPLGMPGTVCGIQTMPMMPIGGTEVMGRVEAMGAVPPVMSGGDVMMNGRATKNGNILSASVTAAPQTPTSDMETQPISLGSAPPYEIDLNSMVAAGETQQVGDDPGGDEDTQAPLGGETQLLDDQEGFDDLVELQNGMLTVPSVPLRNDFADTSHVIEVGGDTAGGVMVAEATAVSNRERQTFVAVQGHETLFTSEVRVVGISESASQPAKEDTESPPAVVVAEQTTASVNEGAGEVHVPIAPSQLSKHEQAPNGAEETSPASIEEGVGKARDDIGGNPSNNPRGTRAEDIKGIKGKQVCKQFGRKKYKGEVVDYDEENKWFKVVYEDGDREDLELEEVIAILMVEETSPTAQKKRPHSKADHSDREGRSAKRRRKEIAIPARKGKTRSRTLKKTGTPSTKRGLRQAKRGRQTSSLHTDSASKSSEARSSELSPVAAVAAEKSSAATSRPQKKVGRKPKSALSGKKETGVAKTAAKQTRSSREEPGREAAPTKTRGAKRGSLSDLSSSKKKEGGRRKAAQVNEKQESPRKRLKFDGFEEQKALVGKPVEKSFEALVGKPVEKSFDGDLYKGVVVKFDRQMKWFKVMYEDGDQEELELEELMAILVQ